MASRWCEMVDCQVDCDARTDRKFVESAGVSKHVRAFIGWSGTSRPKGQFIPSGRIAHFLCDFFNRTTVVLLQQGVLYYWEPGSCQSSASCCKEARDKDAIMKFVTHDGYQPHPPQTVVNWGQQVRSAAAKLSDQGLVLLLHLLRRAQATPPARTANKAHSREPEPAFEGMERRTRNPLLQRARGWAGQGLQLPAGQERRDSTPYQDQRARGQRGHYTRKGCPRSIRRAAE